MLKDPNTRRGVRTILQGAFGLLLLWIVWETAQRITTPAYLLEVVRWSLGIIGLGTVGYIMENSLRAIRFGFGREGLKLEVDGDDNQ